MAELKTKETKESVSAFLKKIPDKTRRDDCLAVAAMMREVTGEKPTMWGPSMVGFGRYHYKGASGREGDWLLTGFAPRKDNLTVYITGGFESFPKIMKRLGKFKAGGGCLYIKRLADIDAEVLKELVEASVKKMEPTRVRG